MPTLNVLDETNTSSAKKQDSMARSDFMTYKYTVFAPAGFTDFDENFIKFRPLKEVIDFFNYDF